MARKPKAEKTEWSEKEWRGLIAAELSAAQAKLKHLIDLQTTHQAHLATQIAQTQSLIMHASAQVQNWERGYPPLP